MSTNPPEKRLIDEHGNVYRVDFFRGPVRTGERDVTFGQPNYELDSHGFRQKVWEKGDHGEDLYVGQSIPEITSSPGPAALLLLLIVILSVFVPLVYAGWLIKNGWKSRPPYQLWLLVGMCSLTAVVNPISALEVVPHIGLVVGMFYSAAAILLGFYLFWQYLLRYSQIQLSPNLSLRVKAAQPFPLVLFFLWLVRFIILNAPRLAYPWYYTLSFIALIVLTCLFTFFYNTFLPTFHDVDISTRAMLPSVLVSLVLIPLIFMFTHPDLLITDLIPNLFSIPSNAILVGVAGGLAGWLGIRLNRRFTARHA